MAERGENVPARIKRECRKLGCLNLTANACGYCDEHLNEAHLKYDRYRGSSNESGYNSRWQRYRKWFLARNPLCAVCGELATVVDHIVPHKGDKALFWDKNNHQPLCERCHNIKTAREDGGFGSRIVKKG